MRAYAGLLRSLLIYYGHPLRRRRLEALYRPFVRPGGLVVDGGAHVGNHTRVFRRLRARVLAVEPQPLFADFLERAFRRDREVIVIRAGLGAAPGTARLFISSRHPTVSTLDADWLAGRQGDPSFGGTRWDHSAQVRVTTLDELIAAHGRPDLVKLDAEGAEPDILDGLSQPVPAIVFEALPGAVAAAGDCVKRLSELGFTRFNWSIGERAALQARWTDVTGVRRMLEKLPGEARERNIFAAP